MAPRNKKNGNGSGYNSSLAQTVDLSDYDPQQDLMQSAEFPSVVKELIEPGEDVISLLMRTVFKDANEANASIIWYHKCDKWGIESGKQILLNKLASNVSIAGLSRDEVIQVATGILRETGKKPSAFKFRNRKAVQNEAAQN